MNLTEDYRKESSKALVKDVAIKKDVQCVLLLVTFQVFVRALCRERHGRDNCLTIILPLGCIRDKRPRGHA